MITPFPSNQARLTCHPDTNTCVIEGIEAYVSWKRSNALTLTYALTGDLIRLRIPPVQAPARAERLWQHTCFEAFIAVKGSPGYYEFNFAPSGEWAIYRFQRYRDGRWLQDDALAPKITVRNGISRLGLEATVRLYRLPAIPPRARLRLALAAVIEDERGMFSYWALKHPPGQPDFHHPDAFALELEPPAVDAANQSALEKR